MRAVDTGKPDLIILDVMMEQPDDGFVVAQDLRRKGLTTPIIILSSIGHVTGYKYDKDSEVAPVDEFVSKPVAPADLLVKVKVLLGRKK
jgi:DNA-binding response OmpR family regulator